MRTRVATEDIVTAYKATGSVWRAGKMVGLSGQTVHDRLRAMGYRLNGSRWTDEERAEMLRLAEEGLACGQIAHRLGRSFNAVACQLSEAGVKLKRNRPTKLPRGAGYDKASIVKHVKALEASGQPVTHYARAHAMSVENLVRAIQQYAPEAWVAYTKRIGGPETKTCTYCRTEFYPANGKQQFCTRQCAAHSRADASYFEGRRRNTVGLAEGVCQLCGKHQRKGLSSHHVFGKENDLETLIALCAGCHKLVTLLGSRSFVLDTEKWETLIQLAVMRKMGDRLADLDGKELYTYVEVEIEDPDEGTSTPVDHPWTGADVNLGRMANGEPGMIPERAGSRSEAVPVQGGLL
jgi:hypothetical protein